MKCAPPPPLWGPIPISFLPESVTSSRTSTTTTFLSAASSVDRSSEGVTRGRELGAEKDGGDDIEEAETIEVFVLRLEPEMTTAAAALAAARRAGTLLKGLVRREETEESILFDGLGATLWVEQKKRKKTKSVIDLYTQRKTLSLFLSFFSIFVFLFTVGASIVFYCCAG